MLFYKRNTKEFSCVFTLYRASLEYTIIIVEVWEKLEITHSSISRFSQTSTRISITA